VLLLHYLNETSPDHSTENIRMHSYLFPLGQQFVDRSRYDLKHSMNIQSDHSTVHHGQWPSNQQQSRSLHLYNISQNDKCYHMLMESGIALQVNVTMAYGHIGSDTVRTGDTLAPVPKCPDTSAPGAKAERVRTIGRAHFGPWAQTLSHKCQSIQRLCLQWNIVKTVHAVKIL